jgi:leucyl aminopeptidase
MRIEFVDVPSPAAARAVFVHADRRLSPTAAELDGAAGGGLARAIASGRFTGAAGQTSVVLGLSGVEGAVIAVGAGEGAQFAGAKVEAAAASALTAANGAGATALAIDARDLDPADAARAALGARLASYRFDKYRTQQKPDKAPTVTSVEVATRDRAAAEAAYADLKALGDAIFFARDLVAEPANELYPAEFARRCQALSSLGLEVEVMGEAELERLGFRTLLGVGRGSAKESQLVVLRWNGGGDAQPLCFVGKGVCFDSGGLSLKPADSMEDMKWDMGGAAAVGGAMMALAGRKAKVNAVGVLGLVENMPDGDAQRPGDVVKTLSGQTVEVLNTDAEGRLVLADALWYAQDRFKPRFMVDFATLTGAMIVALGNDYAGLFCNDDELASKLQAASEASGDLLWRMPLPDAYNKLIEAPTADWKNTAGRAGGSITAALFLQKFVGGVPWAHVDIAPTAWKKPSTVPTVPEGATGYGVRLVDELVRAYEA